MRPISSIPCTRSVSLVTAALECIPDVVIACPEETGTILRTAFALARLSGVDVAKPLKQVVRMSQLN